MPKLFKQANWDKSVQTCASKLIDLALAEDLGFRRIDLTTDSIVPSGSQATARIVARDQGVVCGLKIAQMISDLSKISNSEGDFEIKVHIEDGNSIQPKQAAATLSGDAKMILTYERTILNFLGRLSGIATLTDRFKQATASSEVDICDTRKTTPGWRMLEKYAVLCGGGKNHRLGLFDAVLIKDNHIAFRCSRSENPDDEILNAIQNAKSYLGEDLESTIIEVEVDTLDQYQKVATSQPDVILLDNMSLDQLRKAVDMRTEHSWKFELEASGGVTIETVEGIAKTGVDRISIGALTHSATNFDFGLDWEITSD